MLYLVATPIGNLSDFSERAIATLQSVDLILCEDTRHSQILLNHYNIKKPLQSFHKFSEAKNEQEIIDKLHAGAKIALISDAGTPALADPGERLVRRVIDEKLPLTAIPGAAALIMALILSGFSTTRFQFVGFLPKATNERQTALLDILSYSGTTVCYESPHQIQKTLEILHELAPTRPLVIARELTKMYEELLRGNAETLLSHEYRGEIVLLIEGAKVDPWAHLTLEEHVEYIEKAFHLSELDAIKVVARLRQVPKREVYKIKNL